jgi:hypothetical protein
MDGIALQHTGAGLGMGDKFGAVIGEDGAPACHRRCLPDLWR